jgi:hypothetical protein
MKKGGKEGEYPLFPYSIQENREVILISRLPHYLIKIQNINNYIKKYLFGMMFPIFLKKIFI